MAKIAYQTTVGQAHDLRFVSENYIPKAKETVIEGNILPDINTLHSAEYKIYLETEAQKIVAREKANQALQDKHKHKNKNQLTDADVLEYWRQRMADEMNLDG